MFVESAGDVRVAMIAIKAERASEPDIVIVFEQGGNDIVLVGGLLVHDITEDGVMIAVETVQTIISAQPHESIAVAQAAQHSVVAQSVGSHVFPEHDTASLSRCEGEQQADKQQEAVSCSHTWWFDLQILCKDTKMALINGQMIS